MLRSMHDLERYTIAATDGNIGEVTDFLFDDEEWVVRYFVVETGSWLSSRKVLISPIGIEKANWGEHVFDTVILPCWHHPSAYCHQGNQQKQNGISGWKFKCHC